MIRSANVCVAGMEWSKWRAGITKLHNHPTFTLPFYKTCSRPMDLHAGAMRNRHQQYASLHTRVCIQAPMGQPGQRCHPTAMYVVFESPRADCSLKAPSELLAANQEVMEFSFPPVPSVGNDNPRPRWAASPNTLCGQEESRQRMVY